MHQYIVIHFACMPIFAFLSNACCLNRLIHPANVEPFLAYLLTRRVQKLRSDIWLVYGFWIGRRGMPALTNPRISSAMACLMSNSPFGDGEPNPKPDAQRRFRWKDTSKCVSDALGAKRVRHWAAEIDALARALPDAVVCWWHKFATCCKSIFIIVYY